MTPVKSQISKFQDDKILPSGLQRVMAALLMSVKRVKSSVHVSVLSVSICTATVHTMRGHHSMHILSGREKIMLQTLFIICRKNPQ
jgi:hypothetical protein